MSVEPTAGAIRAAGPKPSGLVGAGGADFNMFLKLLTTQMQNQDPLDPMDTSQYTQQLVQYSQVEQSVAQTGLLREMLGKLSASDMTEAAGLIGRDVEFDNAITGLRNGPARWTWSVPQKAASVTGEIIDSAGRTLATVALDGGSTAGEYSWDGTLAEGKQAPPGAYTLKLKAEDTLGNSIPVTVHAVGQVHEVVQRGGELWLDVGGASLPLADLVRVATAARA